jgi:hypothetical protein
VFKAVDVPTPDHIGSSVLVSAFATSAYSPVFIYSPIRVKRPAHRKDYVINLLGYALEGPLVGK